LFITAAICLLSGSSSAKAPAKKVLIVYLSRTNNTKIITEIIHKQVGGTLVGLELVKPYPETVQQVVKENETGYLPPLKTKIDNIATAHEKFLTSV
jgi:hypothetical protein